MGFVVIHPATPAYKPTQAQVAALLDVLRSEGIIGQASPQIGPLAWEHGSGFDKLNITARSIPVTISIAVQDALVLPAPDDGAEDWEKTLSRQYLTIAIHDADPIEPGQMGHPVWQRMADAVGCQMAALYWHV